MRGAAISNLNSGWQHGQARTHASFPWTQLHSSSSSNPAATARQRPVIDSPSRPKTPASVALMPEQQPSQYRADPYENLMTRTHGPCPASSREETSSIYMPDEQHNGMGWTVVERSGGYEEFGVFPSQGSQTSWNHPGPYWETR
ncbi:hypothetical protein FRC02_004311 [Tulasnella sp. 418]|nr:hypothetical protein FRC02_004311 [Tulasnella sp. 418]